MVGSNYLSAFPSSRKAAKATLRYSPSNFSG